MEKESLIIFIITVHIFNWGHRQLSGAAFADYVPGSRQRFTNYPTTGCPDGWVTFADSCYWVEQEKFSYAKAEEKCYEKNATLLVLNSQDEWDALRQHTPKTYYTWLGLIRLTNDSRWLRSNEVANDGQDTPVWQTEGAVNPTKINWLVRPYGPLVNGWSSVSNCVAHFRPAVDIENTDYVFYYPCNYEFYSICERNNTILDFLNRKFDFEV
ncbi:unnamed protein product [Caenorhabditis bovis]|uniref:C-type lectin domain-containing protein n=1 Tax=Caenorhabditis bovis TaxID=2654633 RepID=A0A8S1EMT6_9PELO|nr:unnamed protein product [Caenorhabditis bovis]